MAALEVRGVDLVAKGLAQFVGDLDTAERAIAKFIDATERSARSAGIAGELGGAERAVSKFGDATEHAARQASGFGEIVTGALRQVGALGVNALVGLGTSVVSAGASFVQSGLSMNNALQQTTAQLNAFTKDGAATAAIIAQLRTEAAATPFEFQDMAAAAASLLPAAKASGTGLMDLIKIGEILAASNPMEGLQGASFALKEAISGDFTSIIERFNLSRQRLNELKDQGVPALEAVQIAMKEMGLDADLVANMADTMEGRWSTFSDTMTTLAATMTRPIFDLASEGLRELQGVLDANMPALEGFVTLIGEGVGTAIKDVAGGIVAFVDAWREAGAATDGFLEQFGATLDLLTGADGTFQAIGATLQGLWDQFQAGGTESTALGSALGNLSGIWSMLQSTVQTVAEAYMNIISAVLPVIQRFIAEHGDGIMALFQTAWDTIVLLVQAGIALYNAVVPPVLNAVAGFIKEHGDTIALFVGNTWEIIRSVIDAALAIIQGLVKVFLALIQGDWQGAWDAIKEMASRVWEDIKNIFSAAASSLGYVMRNIIDTLIGAWQDFVQAAPGIGRSIIDGIKNGIVNAASALASAAANAAREALDAAKSALGISSPSRRASEEVGKPFILGIIEGIQAMAAAMNQAVRDAMITDLFDPVQEIVDKTKDMLRDFQTGTFRGRASLFRLQAAGIEQVGGLGTAREVQDEKAALKAWQETEAALAGMPLFSQEWTEQLQKSKAALADLTAIQQENAVTTRYNTKLDEVQTKTQKDLTALSAEAAEIAKTDAEAASAFYDLRQRQILELAKLELEKAEAGTDAEAAAVQQRIDLITQAQTQEAELLRLEQEQRRERLAEEQQTFRDFFDKIHAWMNEMDEDAWFIPTQNLLSMLEQAIAAIGQAASVNPFANVPTGGPPQSAGGATTNNYTYSPTYGGGPPPGVVQEFWILRSLVG